MKLYSNHIKQFLYLPVIIVVFSCNQKEKETERENGYSTVLKTPEDSLFHEVMEDHNVAMAKMGRLNRYIKQVKSQIDSTEKLPSNTRKSLSSYKRNLDSLYAKLRNAEASMNTWMEEFNLDSASEGNQNRGKYLESEKFKVRDVKDQILTGITMADSVFARLGYAVKN